MIKVDDRATLLTERDTRRQLAQQRDTKRNKTTAKTKATIFRERTEFSAFDETGFPTADADGKPLSKNAVKKLKKERDRQATFGKT